MLYFEPMKIPIFCHLQKVSVFYRLKWQLHVQQWPENPIFNLSKVKVHEFHARNRNTVNCRRLNRILNTLNVHITKRNYSKRGKIERNDSKALKRDSVELANESFAIRCIELNWIELEFCWMFHPFQSCSMKSWLFRFGRCRIVSHRNGIETFLALCNNEMKAIHSTRTW